MQAIKAIILHAVLIFTFPVMLLAQRNDGAVIPGDFADPICHQG
jgi:hypothetical protein